MILPLLAIIGTVTSIHDGDTFRIGSQAIRLYAIDANEMNGTCHTTCASLTATQARDNLAQLIQGKRVTCEPMGKSYQRIVADCTLTDKPINLSCYQLHTGAAVYWVRFDKGGRIKKECGL